MFTENFLETFSGSTNNSPNAQITLRLMEILSSLLQPNLSFQKKTNLLMVKKILAICSNYCL